jgi:hypothetical protein
MPVSKAAQVINREKEIAAINLRRTGMTYSEIAHELGYSDHAGALRAVRRGLQRALQEPADDLRQIEAARLDRAQEKIWAKVEEGDPKAITVLLRIMERRAKLMGLDMPTVIQQDVTVFDGSSDLDREVQRLAEILASDGHAHRGGIEDAVVIDSSEDGTEES